MSSNNQSEYLFKVFVIGNASAGKSSFIARFCGGTFDENYASTIGVDFQAKTIPYRGYNVKLHIWDTSGQERFRKITATYYRGVDGILIFYDVTDSASFVSLKSWVDEARSLSREDIPIVLVGNKIDLIEKRVVSTKQGQELADFLNVAFGEISTCKDYYIEEIIEILCSKIFSNKQSNSQPQSMPQSLQMQDMVSSRASWCWCWCW